MLTTLQHHFANNFTVLSNYTYSHCISDTDLSGEISGSYRENPFSRSMERGNCMFDHRHLFNLSFIAASPGVGQGWERRLTKNWQMSTIFRAASGGPLNILTGSDQSKSGQNNDRPNQVLADVYPATQTTSQWILPSAFAIQPVGTFGNIGKNLLYGPGTIGANIALGRTFQLTERWSMMFRGEAFNVANHANWNNPTTTISSGQFGQITTFGSPRVIQFALKLLF